MCDPQTLTNKKLNIALHLLDREIGRGNSHTYRRNCKMWRTLICDKAAVYKKVWTVSSKSKIFYLGDRLYLDDFRTCYSLNGLNALPTLIYNKNDKSHSYRLEDNLHCPVNTATLPFPSAGHRPYVLSLTKCNNLICIDLPSGQIFKQIFLGRHGDVCFKYISWDVDFERAVVCTTQSKSSSMLKSFVMINVFPFEVIGQFTVSKEVFGKDIADAIITDGLLIVMHKNNKIKMYNLDNIIKENMTFSISQEEASHSTGAMPSQLSSGNHNGIPSNIQLTECPSPLLEVTCYDRNVSIGGHPWHYMYVPLDNDPHLTPDSDTGVDTYLVCDVATHQMVESGPLDMECYSINDTNAFFHFDDSQRIVQLGDYEIIVSTFHTREDGKSELRVAYRLHPPDAEDDSKDDVLTTASGRTVKQSSSSNWSHSLSNKSRISDVNYDEELDFLLLSYATQEVMDVPYQSSAMLEGQLGIHCNQTGHLLKMVDLDGLWYEFQPTVIEMDMDFMVQIYTKTPSVKQVCKLYRLQRPVDDTK